MVKMINFMRMLPIIFWKSVRFLFLGYVPVLQWILILFISWSSAYHCLFIEHLLRVRHCSKCFIVCITSFDPQGISITIPILLTRNLRPRVTCRRAGFWILVFQRTHYQPLATASTSYPSECHFLFSPQIPHWSIDRNTHMYFAHKLGRLS